jgi:hypothetical protein
MLTVMNPEVAVNTDCLVDECLWPDTSDQIALVKGQLLGTPGEVPHTSRYVIAADKEVYAAGLLDSDSMELLNTTSMGEGDLPML